MGRHVDDPDLKPEAIRGFTTSILRDLRALERLLEDGWIEEGVRRFGVEQEFFLIGEDWRPAPIALKVLERLACPPFTTELALFNLEANLAPLALSGRCFRELEATLDETVDQVRQAAEAAGGRVVLSGSLPTLVKSDLSLDQMTPVPRYRTLNEALTRMRGGEYHLQIEGTDELILQHDSLMLEACNTSFQVHLQVGAREFPKLYNTAQYMLAPVLAAAVNSPLLFGRRLWAETRIAIFQQSVDTRAATPYVRDLAPRVHFGDRWVDASVTELFETDLTQFKVLMAGPVEEDPFERMEAGAAPTLDALQLYNSTIYRWNRPCYGISDGRPHLRIECRALPSGPSVVDEVANAAFWSGLVLGGAEAFGDPAERMDFGDVKSNFLAVARGGLGSGIRWLDGSNIGVQTLILEKLLPVARQGLLASGVGDEDVDRYLGIIEGRVASGQTGSEWALGSLAGMEKAGSRAERLAALTAATMRNQVERDPVHRWPRARLSDSGASVHNYMRVGQYMHTHLRTVHEDESVDLVTFVMDREGIRHLPVEDHQHRLVGVVSYRSILRYVGDREGPGRDGSDPVKEIMDPEPVTVSPETPTLEAIRLMRDGDVACLPVVEGDRLVGLVTERDFVPIAYELLEERIRSDRG